MTKSGAKRRRRPANKILMAATARTAKGRLNYIVDSIFDEQLQNPIADEIAHFTVEMALGRGSNQKKLLRWAKKFAKYRLGG